eukprot:COSAG02_NODE_67226_length_253_cov_0.974026_1_plen_27_part_10
MVELLVSVVRSLKAVDRNLVDSHQSNI